MKRTLLAAILVVTGLIGVGCGPDKDDAASTTTTTTTTIPDGATDKKNAEKYLLIQADLPDGWTGSEPLEMTADDKKQAGVFASCLGRPDPYSLINAEAISRTFEKTDSQLYQVVQALKSTSDVQADFDAIQKPSAESCFLSSTESTVKSAFEEQGLKGLKYSVVISSIPGFQDTSKTIGKRAVVTVTGTQSTKVYVDSVYQTFDRFESSMTSVSYPSPLDLTITAGLANKISAKFAA